MERCKGYVLFNDTWMPAVRLETPKQVWSWCNLHKGWAEELRVVHDSDETICVHVVAGRLVFPTEAEGMSRHAIAWFNGGDSLEES